MTKSTKILLTALLGLSLCGIVSACKKGPAEKVGENIDNAVQDTKDAGRDLKKDISK